ncbi:hypothetical protein LDENG_00068930, partial [Lucifuga dentata]
MLFVMASLHENTVVETLLATIHLEKYLDTFRRAGLLLARDFIHLDHDALVSLGITATGHRKRILRLVNHIKRTHEKSLTEGQNTNRNPGTELLLDRCHSVVDIPSSEQGQTAAPPNQLAAPVKFEVFRNSSAPNLTAMLTNSSSTAANSNNVVKPTLKPVPKPRTVFNRRRTAPIHFSCPTSEPLPPPPRRLSQESICFTILESLNSADTDTPNDRLTSNLNEKSTSLPKRRPSQMERTPSHNSSTVSDSGGLLPPVPPRLNRGVPPSIFQGSPPSASSSFSPVHSDWNQTSSLSSLPLSPGSLDNTRLSGSSPSGSPRSGGMEMVSNEIYWGTLHGSAATSGGKADCSQHPGPPPPPRQTPERNSGSTLSNNSSGSARASTDDPEEEISPYCETVFQTRRYPQLCESERTKMDGRETKKEEEKHAEDHGSQKLSWARRLSQALHSGESQGYSTVGEPLPPNRCLSVPTHSYPSETDEDLTISPYASYTSLSERAAPIICSWLDKLSPQGGQRSVVTVLLRLLASAPPCIFFLLRSCPCLITIFPSSSSSSSSSSSLHSVRNYVFQKRYVKFDGKNLMYFGSEKDVYPKGVIPLAAIQMTRPAKDNKFEIVTSHRIFVFRTDNE